MSDNFLEELGLDGEDLKWEQLAACKRTDPKYFDKYYQENPAFRPMVDEICLSCPVLKECLTWGIEKKESFVWGGYYLDNGEVVEELNDHKTESFKIEMRERLR